VEIAGEAGSGKTQLLLSTISDALAICKESIAIVVVTEGPFQTDRFAEIHRARHPDCTSCADRVFSFSCT